MASVSVGVETSGAGNYKEVARRLRDAGRGDLKRKLAKAIRKEGDPALAETKTAWLGVHVTGDKGGGTGKSTGLRARISAATRISVLGSGIRIRTEAKQVDPKYGKTLTYGVDGLGRWRHPTFGRRARPEDWHSEYGEEVFFKTLYGHERAWRAGIEQAMDETVRQIEGG